ncbi:MAG: putative DNA binding domain-containing protein [Opitutaceae bacterium]|jgi:ATP-dependent DNA helicase RecG|nr:putative DNA binding domain-containing protein [Opitutaceae bacterium]
MPETQHAEWKESWRDDHLRQVCGFANAEGGALHIGRNDRGEVVGVPDARKLLEDLPNKIRDLLGIIVPVNLHRKAGKAWLEIVVPPYPSPISYRGHYYQRVGSTNQELKGASLDRFLLRRYGRTWDGSPLPGVTAGDLSSSAFSRFRQQAERSGRLVAHQIPEGGGEL